MFVLDFLSLGRFPSMQEIGRPPNAAQKEVFQRIRVALTVCGSFSQNFPLVPGRSGPELASCLMHLEHFVFGCPEFANAYSNVPLSKFSHDPSLLPADRYPQLVPHRDLNADRLKLVGEGKWPMEKYLRNNLWLPFQEPAFLNHGLSISGASIPSFRFESSEECLKLAKLWDTRGVLSLYGSPAKPGYFCRVFQVYKGPDIDRQIGDRRLPNASEFHVDGPSRFLPPGPLLCQLHVPRNTHRILGSVTDRRDFYHQAQVSEERAQTNMLPFSYPIERFHGTSAYGELLERDLASRRKRDRTTCGDRFGLRERRKGLLVPEVFPAFRSLFQGDHLGVEFALASHEQLLSDEGLLLPSRRLLGHFPVPDSPGLEGLIIDDYFAIGIEHKETPTEASFAFTALAEARAAYEKHELPGSPEKDVIAESRFKAAGAEIDSSPATVGQGLVTVSAPWSKRFALSVLSLRAARLPVISRKLAVRLFGNWVSVLLYRRCWSSLVDDFFALGASCESDSGEDGGGLVKLSRRCAQELALLSAIVPLVFTNVSVDYRPVLYASDSSSKLGAFTVAPLPVDESKLLWRNADKKGFYTKLDSPVRAILRELVPETEIIEEVLHEGPFKAPLLSFDFVEFYGGAGVVSKHMSSLGFCVAPVLDLSNSRHYDISDLRLVEWAVYMIEEERFRSYLVEPPCTSFSAAAHPSVRSYEIPLGYDRTEPKTLHGNTPAFRAFVLLRVGRRKNRPCGLEQPRLSKMAWLQFWQTLLLLGFEESIIASCQFGSPHKKEFRFLLHKVDAKRLDTRCPGGHSHIRIEGRWTKGSAVYTDGLARHLALGFAHALRLDFAGDSGPDVCGFESPVVNDMMDTCHWTLGKCWTWAKQSHINVYETEASVEALADACLKGPHQRGCFVVDSLVAKGALTKGRSSSRKLQPALKRSCALQVAFDWYPVWCYSPTRLNVPDDPTRGVSLRPAVRHSLRSALESHELELLHQSGLRRFAANWLRLVVLASALVGSDGKQSEDFTDTLEWVLPVHCLLPLLCFLVVTFGVWTFSFDCFRANCRSFPRRRVWSRSYRWTFLWCWLSVLCACPRLGLAAMGPLTAAESRRAAERSDLPLPADRVIREQTRNSRKVLVARFQTWLWKEHSVSLNNMLQQKPVDPETISHWLAEYGREMYRSGKAYGQYSETINGIAMIKPIIKKQLAPAWDIAFAWLVDEPHQHNPALPLSVLLAMLTVALTWGWPFEAAVISLCWAGIMRIGEVLQASRADLILPQDQAPGFDFILLRIKEPKTRGRHARHQAARIDQSDVVALVSAVYGPMAPSEALWPFSAATLRKRFNALLAALDLPTEKKAGAQPFTLGSLRPGGATFLLFASESSELVRRRGRWLSSRVMEIYLQEVLACTYVKKLDPKVREKIERFSLGFAGILERVIGFLQHGIPSKTWRWLLRAEAGLQMGDAGKKWQNSSNETCPRGATWHHRHHGLAEKGDLLDHKHSTVACRCSRAHPARPFCSALASLNSFFVAEFIQ